MSDKVYFIGCPSIKIIVVGAQILGGILRQYPANYIGLTIGSSRFPFQVEDVYMGLLHLGLKNFAATGAIDYWVKTPEL
jgi:hypothetical protein